MPPLPSDLRKSLDKAVVAARDEAESACEAALRALGVPADLAPPGISDEQRALRNALRAKQRQLGGAFEQLISECAYEQWHLMLFARFLAENELLIHPSGAPVTLSEVAELAREEGESDPWLLAARYAAAMLPGIFKTADPCVRLSLAPESRKALEDILTALRSEVFTADDALGWVYQFWQTKRKKEVNASERKIGGADLAPVTQLFTEHYMVRFLLENSLGAWWAARHPASLVLAEWEYLRLADDGSPAAGCFEGWPATASEVTVMDPCCGSGHFLVAAFEMLCRMREEEEGLSTREGADAVLRDNLHGLELDSRCVELAAFALALAAWKVAGYHELPSLNLACSGIPTRGSLEEWTELANGDQRLERALSHLHDLFREADTLGSLIDPRRAVEDGTLDSVPFEEVAPLLERALARDSDPVNAVFGDSASEVARAATMLADSYTLVATNVPYLGSKKMSEPLLKRCQVYAGGTKTNLAVASLERVRAMCSDSGGLGVVAPLALLELTSYARLRRAHLEHTRVRVIGLLGSGAFETVSGEVVSVALIVSEQCGPDPSSLTHFLDAHAVSGIQAKLEVLSRDDLTSLPQADLIRNPDSRISLTSDQSSDLLSIVAISPQGIVNGDAPARARCFWEMPTLRTGWERLQGPVSAPIPFGGRQHIVDFRDGGAGMPRPRLDNKALGRTGVVVARMGGLECTLYSGERYDQSVGAICPEDSSDVAALWSFCVSGEHGRLVRQIDKKINVTSDTLLKVPFDLPRWRKVAENEYPNGLPEPHSDDPTQWLFEGKVVGSDQPLHVALARVLGYRWPDQEPDELDALADEDGIVCLPAVAGERSAHERLRQLLETAHGESFSQQTLDELLDLEGSKTLEEWLRGKAFASHTRIFHNRPFIWHIWDGRKDGFAALMNYHKLDHQTLEKLAFTHLNWWIERQKTDMASRMAGAEARLVAAQELQRKLKLILEGEDPYDIYVRWKSLAAQPLGWEPDLNDGVRLNIRPFVTAGVLRARLSSIKWDKDRGKNPDGSKRLNDLHFTLAEKRAAREEAARSG